MSKKNVKMMATLEMFALSDLCNKTIDDMMKFGSHIMSAKQMEVVDMEVAQKLTKRLQDHIDQYSNVRNDLIEEIGTRLTDGFKITKDPMDIDKMIGIMLKEHPELDKNLKTMKAEYEGKVVKEGGEGSQGIKKLAKDMLGGNGKSGKLKQLKKK